MAIKIEAAARLNASKKQTYYVIRKASTKKTVEVYEGLDGKKRAQELIESHNKFYPNDKWYMVEEYDDF